MPKQTWTFRADKEGMVVVNQAENEHYKFDYIDGSFFTLDTLSESLDC